jgi:hypothetical protein
MRLEKRRDFYNFASHFIIASSIIKLCNRDFAGKIPVLLYFAMYIRKSYKYLNEIFIA